MGPITENAFTDMGMPVVSIHPARESLCSLPSVPSSLTEGVYPCSLINLHLLSKMKFQMINQPTNLVAVGLDTKGLANNWYKTEMCQPFTETGFCKYGA